MAIRVTIRVKPGASRTSVGGDHDGALYVDLNRVLVDQPA